MDSPKLSAVRLVPAKGEGEYLGQDAVILDIPPFNNKFSIQYPSQTDSNLPVPVPPSSERPTLSSSDSGETDFSADESGHELEAADTFDTDHSPPIPRLRPPVQGMNSSPPSQPRFSRAFSLPLPSQLGHLQHPHRPLRPLQPDPTMLPQFRELSLELADSVQMVIQTMLQISPSQVLDPAKEQFAACALAVPTPSMSAMFTAMKNLNYISANMATFCGGSSESLGEDVESLFPSSTRHNDFDIGELLQSTGDALSGVAAQVGVDLVLYHGDVGMKHVWVKGDESALSYLLLHIIRQVLATAHRADTLEIGLFIRSPSSRRQDASTSETDEDDPFKDTPVDLEGSLQCVVEVHHKFGITEHPEGANHIISRPLPSFSTLLIRRLLLKVGASLDTDVETPMGRTSRVTFALEAGSPPIDTPATVTASSEAIGSEPSLEQLTTFVDSLKGKKVHLYANSNGAFAHRLTSYLTAWGMDVSHINAEGGVESLPEAHPSSPTSAPEGYPPGIPKSEPRQPKTQPLSFIFIDDDVSVLKERLQALRPETNFRKRPSLASHHRPRSSPQVTRLAQQTPIATSSHSNPAVILHFTSLSNFKVTKDAVQSLLSSYQGIPFPIPEVMIIPKPAGPRRFLTALHSAVMKPLVDPFFSPIATTPGTPNVHTNGGSFFYGLSTSNTSPKSPNNSHRPTGSRSNSDRSAKVNGEGHGHSSSPLAIPDPAEYFSEPVSNLGHSPSTGLVIQSPDGQPAGIFFHPKARASRQPSSTHMERDKGHLSVGSGSRKGSVSSINSNSVDNQSQQMTFSSLHEVNRAPSYSNTHTGPSGSRAGTRSKPSSPRAPEAPSSPLAAGEALMQPPSRRASADLPLRKPSLSASPPVSPSVEQNAPPSLGRKPTVRRDSNALAPSQSAKKVKSPADPNIVPPISVLIVDDNPINRTILCTFMKKKKVKYDVAANGKEAVEKWRSGDFHLILMDIVMPVMDGIEATIEIRRIEKHNGQSGFPPSTPARELSAAPGPSTPSDTSETTRSVASPYRSSVIIVALTASSSQADRLRALAAGCNDFLTKPVSLLWLNNKLIEWGSIKALQMWADLVPQEMARSQANQARTVAERLHVPRERNISNSSTGGGPSSASPQAVSRSASQDAGKPPSRPTSPRTAASQSRTILSQQQSLGVVSSSSSLSSAAGNGPNPLAWESSQNGNADTRGDLDRVGASTTANRTDKGEEHSSAVSNGVESLVEKQDAVEINTPTPSPPSDLSVSTGEGEGVDQQHSSGNGDDTKAKAIPEASLDTSGEASGANDGQGEVAHGNYR